jgi:GDP-D-mannose 3', 5'-epimerase
MMKICVTGGAGMIGSRLVQELTSLGHDVSVIDNLWRGKRDFVEEIPGFDVASSFFEVDLADPRNIERVTKIFSGCDVVIHLADIVAGIGYVFSNQYQIFKVNNEINSLTFHCCEAAGVGRVIYAGTACSFPKDLQMSLTSVLRDDMLFPAQPESAYGWSKLMGTLELGYLADKTGMQVTTLMLHNVYGPNCDIDPRRSQVIPSLIRRVHELKDGEDLIVWGSGRQGRAFLHVGDVVRGFVAALDTVGCPRIVQLGPSQCTSIGELALHLVEKTFAKRVNVVFDTSKPEGDLGRSADFSLAQATLGWEPRISLADGLRETAEWIRRALEAG